MEIPHKSFRILRRGEKNIHWDVLFEFLSGNTWAGGQVRLQVSTSGNSRNLK